MSASRRTILNRIMQIEEEIKGLSSNAEYRRIKRNLDMLDSTKTISRNVRVRSPSDDTKTIIVRRNSTEREKVVDAYKLKLRAYTSRIDSLSEEKRELTRRLFI